MFCSTWEHVLLHQKYVLTALVRSEISVLPSLKGASFVTNSNNVIQILDTTLREGEQSPGAILQTHEKLEIAHQLVRLGVDVIEAGFPISSPGDFNAVQRVAREVHGPTISAGARAMKADIDAVWNAIKDAPRKQIHIALSVSDIQIERKLRSNRKAVLERGIEMVKYARSLFDQVEYTPEDAGRADREYLAETVEKVIEAGATCVNIPDTTGYCIPSEFGELVAMLFHAVRNMHDVLVSVHCHNDPGLATANSLVGVLNGARRIECTINGIGERVGIAALEEVVMLIKTREQLLRLRTNINSHQIAHTSELVSRLTSIPVQPNKAIVGASAFAHTSGTHQDGVLKDRMNYEIMSPEDIGLTASPLILSSRSGRHAFKHRLHQLGYTIEAEVFNCAYDRFLELADKKKQVTDADLVSLIESCTET